MRIVKVQVAAVVVAVLALTGSAFSQHGFENTVVVDPSGNADETSIQTAIDNIGTTSVKVTVLIYAGTYDENITLNEFDENIDLVGIDREAVIIAPSSGDGIVITSGTETSRNNRIANLTIITSDGHGIEIVKGGTPVPKDIQIEGVTILADGTDKIGIEGSAADTVRIFDCDIESDDDDGIAVGDNFEIIDSVVTALGSGADGVSGTAKDGLRIRNCKIIGKSSGLEMQDVPENLDVYGSEILGGGWGVQLMQGDNVRFEACHIVAGGDVDTSSNPIGVFVDNIGAVGDILFLGCQIESIGGGSIKTVGVRSNSDAAGPGQLRFVDCAITARCTNTTSGGAWGAGDIGYLTIIGGSIVTSAAAVKETEVWDLIDGSVATIRVSGTNLSKWKGPIFAAGRSLSVMQRTIDVDDEVTDVILTATGLTGSEQDNVTPTNQPDVYRVLSVTGNAFEMDQVVYIVGTDWADNDIVDKITLSGTSTIDGVKPFKTVDHIILPAQTSGGQTVKVGTTNKLGLYYPISAGRDVLQQARKASAASSYTLETLESADVDKVYSTILIDTITDGDSFEWALLTGR